MSGQVIRVATAAICDKQGRILLVRKHGTSCFMQPGGKIEPAEEPLETLKRELFEEVGLTISDDEALYLGCYKAAAANEAETLVEAELFWVVAKGQPEASSEIEELLWYAAGQHPEYEIAPLTKVVVLPLLSDLKLT